MDNKVRAQKLLGSYLRWPIIIALIMIVMTGTVMLFDKKSAVVVAVFTLFSISLLIFIYTSSQNMILGSLIKFSMESNNSMMSLYKEMSIPRSEEHTSELQSRQYLVCRLLLEKKKFSSKVHI